MTGSDYTCPICSASLVPTGKAYSLEELLNGWQPAKFSQETVDNLRGQSGRTRLYECATCAFGIYYPQIIGNSSFYREIERASSGEYYQALKWEFGEAVADTRSCNRILDVGCGAGDFLLMAREQVPDVVGVDFNESALSAARERGIQAYPSLEAIPSTGNRFDAVFTFHVLEHVQDPVAFLNRLVDLLGPSGKIGLSVPNMEGPVRFIDPCYMNMPPHHATRWTSKALKSLAERLGLSVEKTLVEPLSSRDRYYYVVHWANKVSAGNRVLQKYLHRGCEIYFRALFGFLSMMGRDLTTLHAGQSVYVLMRKR